MLNKRRYEAKRRAIVEAAKRLLRKFRYQDISVAAIAGEAGISKATFYSYFRSKEALRQVLQDQGIIGQETKDRRATIIEAALRTFAERGFHATSLEDVAAAAGITKGTIYWYFRQKSDLLRAVAEYVSPLLGQLDSLWKLLEHPPEEVLPHLVRTCLATFKNPIASRLFRLIVMEAPHHPEIAQSFATITDRVLEFFTSYLQHQTRLGRLRQSDLNSSVRSFTGMLLIYIIGREMPWLLGTGLPETDTYTKNMVDIFLNGLKPKHPDAPTPARAPAV